MVARRPRSGFALAVTLWVLVGGAALTLAVYTTARDALGTSRNRINELQAYWLASGCEQRAHAAVLGALWPTDFTPAITRHAWAALDSVADPIVVSSEPSCRVTMAPSGLTLDVNVASGDQLKRAIEASGLSASRTDSLVDALLDWRDADDTARALGAERVWYLANHLAPPRNGPFASVLELRGVRGFDTAYGLEKILGVDGSRVLWTRAPEAVLAGLPGMTSEAIAVLNNHRGKVSQLSLLGSFPEISAEARDTLATNAPALRQATTEAPDYWIVSSSATSGSPAIRVTIDTRVTIADKHVIVLSRVVHP